MALGDWMKCGCYKATAVNAAALMTYLGKWMSWQHGLS